VCDQGVVGDGVGIDGAIVIVILGGNSPLGSVELLFQVTSVGLLLLPSEGGGTLTRTTLVKGLARSSHGGEESLLLSMRGSHDGLSHGRDVVLLPLSGSGGGLLLLGREVGGDAHHGQQDGGGGGGGRRRNIGLGQR
jgi:hypothetical protein